MAGPLYSRVFHGTSCSLCPRGHFVLCLSERALGNEITDFHRVPIALLEIIMAAWKMVPYSLG